MSGRLFLPATILMVAALVSGCKPKTTADYTEDLRIDAADETNDPDSYGTKMCMTNDGTVYVIWLDNRSDPGDDTQIDIWMNRSTELGAAGSWLPAPVKVNQGEGQVWNPSLYCNEGGVYVVWEDDRDGDLHYHQIYFNRSQDQGETWLDEDKLLDTDDEEGLAESYEPQIVGAGESLAVVWADTLFGAADILVTTSQDAGDTWKSPERVDSDDPGEAFSAHPQIAVSQSAQDIWVVWEDSRDGASDIYVAHSESGGTDFDKDERLDEGDEDGATGSFSPQLCTDQGENVYVVWHDARGGVNSDIYMNYSGSKGADWSGVATRLDTDAPGFGNSLFPVCAVENSTLHVAWQDRREDEAGVDIYYRDAHAGIPGDAEVRLDVGTPEGYANSLDPHIAFHDSQVMVSWLDARGEVVAGTENGFDDLYYNFKNSTTPFLDADAGDLRMDSWLDGQSFKEDLNVFLLGGSWYAAWTDGRGGTTDVYFATFAIGDESDPLTADDLEGQK